MAIDFITISPVSPERRVIPLAGGKLEELAAIASSIGRNGKLHRCCSSAALTSAALADPHQPVTIFALALKGVVDLRA